MKENTFTGKLSGDMECFCWDDVPLEDVKKILGEERFERDLEDHREFAKDEFNGRCGCCDYRSVYDNETGTWTELATEEEVEKNIEKKMQRIYPTDLFGDYSFEKNATYKFTVKIEKIPEGKE